MSNTPFFASRRQGAELILSAALSSSSLRAQQRRAATGEIQRMHQGIYIDCANDAAVIAQSVRAHWQRIVGALVPGGVVAHLSAIGSGIQADGALLLSHPSQYRKAIALPGLRVVVLRGPGPLAGDFALGDSGLYWAGRTRMLLENLGRKAPSKAGRQVVEQRLIDILHASGDKALNQIRDEAAPLAEALGRHDEAETLREIIGALLGTHARGQLRTRDGQLLYKGTPIDKERMYRFDTLAAYLRGAALPLMANRQPAGSCRRNFAFVESYFSNYVEGTKFTIEDARDIVVNNAVMRDRPKDSHDILGVFRLASTSPFRNNPPVAGEDFLPGLETWHADMLQARPEVNPGQIKLKANYAGTSKFVEPGMVRGTVEEGSRLALSIPEGIARAIYYAFLVSEVHPFEDGNGRLSRLVMNAELARVGL